jgi:hypothetical protein
MLAISAFFADSNYFECCFWIAIGLGFAIAAFVKGPRGMCLITAGTLVLFGVSDYVEAQTGAWWRPWWLLVWKGGCLVVFVALLIRRARTRAPVPSPCKGEG